MKEIAGKLGQRPGGLVARPIYARQILAMLGRNKSGARPPTMPAALVRSRDSLLGLRSCSRVFSCKGSLEPAGLLRSRQCSRPEGQRHRLPPG
jgi:hypothetical protein